MRIEEIKLIEQDNIEIFLSFLIDIAKWLNKNDKAMWNIDKLRKEVFLKNNSDSKCYIGFINDEPVSSIMLKDSDVFIWPNIVDNETLFIGKLAVARDYAGKGLSIEMLDFAREEAKKRNKKFLRLDCYADREHLRYFYESYGFKLVKIREMAPQLYAALYELELQIN